MPSRDVAGFSAEEISRHIQRTVGPISTVFHEIVSDDLHIDVHHVRSTFLRRYEVFVTSGMSAKPMTVPDDMRDFAYAEVLAILPRGWPATKESWFDERNYWPIRLLKDLARYAHHNATWLGYGHTVANGDGDAGPKPYAENTRLCAALLMPSATLGEKAWLLQRADGTQCCFWTVVPLHAAELHYKLEHGVDALTDIFDQRQVFDRIDPQRPSVVP